MSKKKWWLAAMLIVCLAPGALAEREHERGCGKHKKDCQAVPEGGSGAIYLLGAGLTCFGAMFLRSRVAKPAQS